MSEIEKEIGRREKLLSVRIIAVIVFVLMFFVSGFRIMEDSVLAGLMFILMSVLFAVIGFFSLRAQHRRNQRMRKELEDKK